MLKDLKIFEKSTFANEIGAAINVCPNAARILSRWGSDFEQWQPCIAQEVRAPDHKPFPDASRPVSIATDCGFLLDQSHQS